MTASFSLNTAPPCLSFTVTFSQLIKHSILLVFVTVSLISHTCCILLPSSIITISFNPHLTLHPFYLSLLPYSVPFVSCHNLLFCCCHLIQFTINTTLSFHLMTKAHFPFTLSDIPHHLIQFTINTTLSFHLLSHLIFHSHLQAPLISSQLTLQLSSRLLSQSHSIHTLKQPSSHTLSHPSSPSSAHHPSLLSNHLLGVLDLVRAAADDEGLLIGVAG